MQKFTRVVCSNLSIAGLDGLDENSLLGVNLRGALMLGLRTGLWKNTCKHLLKHYFTGNSLAVLNMVACLAHAGGSYEVKVVRHSKVLSPNSLQIDGTNGSQLYFINHF